MNPAGVAGKARRQTSISLGEGDVVVQNNATGQVSYWQKKVEQSAADRNGTSLADYVHAMYGFLVQAKTRRVLMIGCGGGTLATMLHRSGVAVTIVDIDPRSIEIARRYFAMPDDIECHVDDGRGYLSRTRKVFDAIVVDAYSDHSIPEQFQREAFFRLAKSRMKPRGAIFLINIIVGGDEDPVADRMAALMRTAWRQVRLLDAEGYNSRNAVAIAGAVRRLKRPRLVLAPERSAKKLAAELKEMRFRTPRPF